MNITQNPKDYAQHLLDLGFTYVDYVAQYGHYEGHSELVRQAMLDLGDTTAIVESEATEETLVDHIENNNRKPLIDYVVNALGVDEELAACGVALARRRYHNGTGAIPTVQSVQKDLLECTSLVSEIIR